MARFDVHHNRGGSGYLLDCQADILADFNTRLVVPLLPPAIAPTPAGRLNPAFEIEGKTHVMVTQFAGTVPARSLGKVVASLITDDRLIGTAIDMLLSGV